MRWDNEKDVEAHFKSIAQGELGADNHKIERDFGEGSIILFVQEKKNAYLEWMKNSGMESDFVERKLVPVRKAVYETEENGSYWVQYISRDGGLNWRRANG